MLHEQLVDEISLIIAPVVAAASGPAAPGFHLPEGEEPSRQLTLIGNETLRGGHVWLRYAIAAP